MNSFSEVSASVAEEVPMPRSWDFVGIYLGYESAGKREEHTTRATKAKEDFFCLFLECFTV